MDGTWQVGDPLWVIPIVHGFFSQIQFSVHGRPFFLSLISRRSRFFAGTRFLKRGITDLGHVANEVTLTLTLTLTLILTLILTLTLTLTLIGGRSRRLRIRRGRRYGRWRRRGGGAVCQAAGA